MSGEPAVAGAGLELRPVAAVAGEPLQDRGAVELTVGVEVEGDAERAVERATGCERATCSVARSTQSLAPLVMLEMVSKTPSVTPSVAASRSV